MRPEFFETLTTKTTGALFAAATHCERMHKISGEANFLSLALALREIIRLRFAAVERLVAQ